MPQSTRISGPDTYDERQETDLLLNVDFTPNTSMPGSLADGDFGGGAPWCFIDEATARVPTMVLGTVAANRLGVEDLDPVPRLYVDGTWFTVLGIIDEMDSGMMYDVYGGTCP